MDDEVSLKEVIEEYNKDHDINKILAWLMIYEVYVPVYDKKNRKTKKVIEYDENKKYNFDWLYDEKGEDCYLPMLDSLDIELPNFAKYDLWLKLSIRDWFLIILDELEDTNKCDGIILNPYTDLLYIKEDKFCELFDKFVKFLYSLDEDKKKKEIKVDEVNPK